MTLTDKTKTTHRVWEKKKMNRTNPENWEIKPM